MHAVCFVGLLASVIFVNVQDYNRHTAVQNLLVRTRQSSLLAKLFSVRNRNGFFHVRVNATLLFAMDVHVCAHSEHNLHGTIRRSEICKNNAGSYGFVCANDSCTFNFCPDNHHFGRGVISCDN